MSQYIGRFAPSPSGRLHFGSLVAALGSYAVAKINDGKILLRIEDLDFFRCKKEYTRIILKELEEFGFYFDGEPYIQSEHTDVYYKVAKKLVTEGKAFYCNCTRSYLKTNTCQCLQKGLKEDSEDNLALRFIIPKVHQDFFEDEIYGQMSFPVPQESLTLIRRDKVISYNLACVVDDINQGITQVVRGSDLIDITTTQMCLYKALDADYISYLHLPLAMADETYKLSKQNHSPAVLDQGTPSEMLIKALNFLNQDIDGLSSEMSPKTILDKALERFEIKRIPVGKKVIA
ncbi:glutamyl-Q tRNA(Asp) synthetase [Succinivibrio dextrinosolvens]|uniref:tRNA glutamyl-Q(34) synthetase GluQRS n=1 Tax=Succinivibrio dextrinosolvens TaxID=83771 RepID=UPI0008E282CD|nr:tRNA glutamyl-Q(34) synthetase GluQRS [Succinivibrio dextrinosolvens]SFS36451.1 glutamyl-Q tRNA(Asp) synthetase [Succinivibrio dextrinosolvens]